MVGRVGVSLLGCQLRVFSLVNSNFLKVWKFSRHNTGAASNRETTAAEETNIPEAAAAEVVKIEYKTEEGEANGGPPPSSSHGL